MFPGFVFARVKGLRTFAPLGPGAIVALLLAAAIATSGTARAARDDNDKVIEPEEVTLRTNDGVTLNATFYPSTLGKKAVPVILLHASKGSRVDFEELALKLQRADHAVLVPDLRGHGADRAAPLRPDDYPAMVFEDLEAVKKFLMVKNNTGELNIEKLCVVGVEMGAVVAVNWAAHDWSWPMLATGKQGQDVKALVLISPEWVFKTLRLHDAIAHPNVRAEVSVMIIAGESNGKSLKEAKRVYNALERYHPLGPGDEAADSKQTLWLRTPQTSMQGTRLLNEKSMHVDQMILKFIELRLVKQPMPWSDRKGPRD